MDDLRVIGTTSFPTFNPTGVDPHQMVRIDSDTLYTDKYVIDSFDLFDDFGTFVLVPKSGHVVLFFGPDPDHIDHAYFAVERGDKRTYFQYFKRDKGHVLTKRDYGALPDGIIWKLALQAPNWTPPRNPKFPGTTGLPVRGWRPLHTGPSNTPEHDRPLGWRIPPT